MKNIFQTPISKLKEASSWSWDKLKELAEEAGIKSTTPELSYPERGDVIFAVRGKRILGVNLQLYFHYGVYVGGGKVIHFNDPNPNSTTKSKATIIETSLAEFAAGDTVFIEPVDDSIAHNSNEKTAQEAERIYCISTGHYNLAINNCEHFANLCRYNRKKSSQISKFIKIILPSIIINIPKVLPLPPYIKIPTSIITLLAGHFLTNRGKEAHLKQIE